MRTTSDRKAKPKAPKDRARSRARALKIQHNRDALKQLREDPTSEVMLYLIEPDGLKKVWVKHPGLEYEKVDTGVDIVVYASKRRKLVRGYLYKEGGCKVITEGAGTLTVDWKWCLGVVVRVEACGPPPVSSKP
jgi:hypothetical protein